MYLAVFPKGLLRETPQTVISDHLAPPTPSPFDKSNLNQRQQDGKEIDDSELCVVVVGMLAAVFWGGEKEVAP
jgi:hypothetical protein